MDLSEKLQQLRKQKELTQEELAELLFVSRTAISKWESGRGCPNIESLKAISKLFSISIDELLSGEELIVVAEKQVQEKTRSICVLLSGILDCMMLLLLFLPFYGQKSGEIYLSVNLFSLTSIEDYLWYLYVAVIAVNSVFGIIQLALQNCGNKLWIQSRKIVSFGLTFLGTILFVISRQPYAAFYLLCILGIKVVLLIKQQ
ncbi:MAG: helix-turn-helix transcriptional regulator [Lachnospiraceae bacterium]|nr:helix-turn-helix transcriptional regulator [Lachnospiraceae bacterium]